MTQKALDILQAAAGHLSNMTIAFGQAEQAANVIAHIKAAAEEINKSLQQESQAKKNKKGIKANVTQAHSQDNKGNA